MFRLFLALHFLFFNLYACKGGYDTCKQKAKDANIFQKNALVLPLKNKRCLLYSRHIPNIKILKYDPFLSLYFVKEKKHFAYPYDINMRLQLGTAIINTKEAKEGKFLQSQIGLNRFAKYNQTLASPALISSSCCSVEGIVSSKGVIQKEYIKHFLHTKKARYGDIGIRVYNKKGAVTVKASDPFMKENPFKINDCIIEYDRKKVSDAASLMQKILFSSVGSRHQVKIKRASKELTFMLTCKQRYGGGFLSDTFLEQKGIYFDERLHVSALNKKSQTYGLKLGDKLIQVNGVSVKSQDQLRRYIKNFKEHASLLFERNNFQFFVNIK
ncbi:DUF7488 domain-containing protein [Sulfurimonas sp.]